MESQPVLTGRFLADALATIDRTTKGAIVMFELTREGGQIFSEARYRRPSGSSRRGWSHLGNGHGRPLAWPCQARGDSRPAGTQDSLKSLEGDDMRPDRKALRRQYLDTPRTAGIGVVRNTVTGKILLLAGRDLPALLNRNRAQLRLGAHRNAELQGDWKTLGEQSFAFEIVDTLTPKDTPGSDPGDDLRALEALWLEKLAPFGSAGYNRPTKQ